MTKGHKSDTKKDQIIIIQMGLKRGRGRGLLLFTDTAMSVTSLKIQRTLHGTQQAGQLNKHMCH